MGGSPAQRRGVGPPGRGHDEHVVARQRPGGEEKEPAQVRVVERALGHVHDGRHPRARPTTKAPRRRRKVERGWVRRAERGGQVRAGVLEAGHRRLQVGVRHPGRQVDDVAAEARCPVSARRRWAKCWMSASTTCGAAQFITRLRTRDSGPWPGWKATPNGAVSGCTRRRASRRCRPAPAAPRRAQARGRAPRNIVSTTMQSAAKPSRMAHRSRCWPGTGPMKIRRRSSLTPRTPRLDDDSRSGLATIRSWASYSSAKGTNAAPVASTLWR